MSATGLGVPAGPWRWAALGCVIVALLAAGLALAAPQVAGLAGHALLGGIALVAILLLAGSRVIRPVTVSIRIGEAIETAGVTVEGRNDLIARVRARIEALLAEGPVLD